ncbi:MAG: efflux RND transporter periplasmic adaptor subunit [Chitinophagaceae bacterium]|nr:efflux RND transporter periplasmic adaptor subunit [Oligoflexus sp.]
MSQTNKPLPLSVKIGFIVFFVAAISAVVFGVLHQKNSVENERKERTEELARGQKIKVAKATQSPTERVLKISGEARAYANVTLYAKLSGYLKNIKVDKGDRVKKGQILATIESPETEQAYRAAQSEAKNKKAIADRTKSLLDRQLVSQQEADQVFADAEVAAARLVAQEAQKSYQTLRAPFDGTVTARFADPGALVQNATNAQTGALPLLSISQLDQLRVFVYLDQRDVSYVKVGTPAEVALAERPGVVLNGHVSRISGQLDDKTRMLLTEIDLDNNKSEIVAGSLVDVTMHLSSPAGVDIPSEALILQGPKTVVGVIDDQNTINYTEVKVLDNNGEKVKLSGGLTPGQTVALGVGNTLPNKSKVRPIVDEPKSGAPGPAAAAEAPSTGGSSNLSTVATPAVAPASDSEVKK